MTSFGKGQPVRRSEDPRLLTGRGRYVADIVLEGECVAQFLRSDHAHAEIAAIDVAAARALPGVLAVYTAADASADGLGPLPCVVPVKTRDGTRAARPGRPLFADERVCFVGDTVAMVVAETPAIARDAIEHIAVDYRPLPAISGIEDALAAGAPQLWDTAPGNRAFFWQNGDEKAVDAAFARAPHRIGLRLVNNRVVPSPMEPRAAIGVVDPDEDRFTLYTSSQGGHLIREVLAKHTLMIPEDRIRVVVPDVGGGFGTKIFHYAEEALVLWAAGKLGRPVKWIGERADSFLCDTHGRDQIDEVEAAVADDGRILALRVAILANMGAYLNYFAPAIPSQSTGCMLSGAYAIDAIFATCEGVYTNTVPVDAYRGAGRPEATYLLERTMDRVAHELGLARDEIRRRNFIAPEAMPYATAAGPTYDSGAFAANLDDALAAADWSGFARRRETAAASGRLRGIGVSTYVEICGFDDEEATVRFDEDGTIEILIGTQSTGQGHETAYAQIAADTLGVPFSAIRVVQGDTDRIAVGQGTSGSRSIPVGGPAVVNACVAVIERGKRFAAHLLQAGEDEVAYVEGRFSVGGEREVALNALAAAARSPENLPPDEDRPGLDASGRYALEAPTFPNGCHVCEVEIDQDTGTVEILGYVVVDDFGTVINPLLVSGQIHGGVAQGIGQALFEQAAYDRDSAQLLSASFADYALPHADDVPAMRIDFNCVPCTTNPLGVKGAGEAGAIAACPAVVNAVIDALRPLGVDHMDMPVTAEKVWQAIAAAGGSTALGRTQGNTQ